MTGRYPQNAPWESRNGYIPPPRFQQLRALDNLQQQQQGSTLKMSPSHARSPSLFSFFRCNNSTNAQTSAASQNTQSVQASVSPPPNQQPFGQQQPQLLRSPQPSVVVPFNQPQAQSRPQSQPQPQTASSSPNMARDPNLQQPGLTRTLSMQESSQPPASTPNPIHPEIRSVVQLTVAQARKNYFSGPLIRKLERQPDGQKPQKDDGWVDVWAQLDGTTLSYWDMKEIQQASRQGKEVPPSYINVTDAVRIFHR
jgi:CCR4-NOT transcriptional complex subunit CAF120